MLDAALWALKLGQPTRIEASRKLRTRVLIINPWDANTCRTI